MVCSLSHWHLLMSRSFYFHKVYLIKFFFCDFMTPKLTENVFSSRSFMVWVTSTYNPSHWFQVLHLRYGVLHLGKRKTQLLISN